MQDFLHTAEHIFAHPLIETLKMAPILFLAYLFMEWLEKKEGSKIANTFKKVKKSGPLFASLVGIIPQCGFSGAIAGMYAAGTVTAGTLLAVMLATSDEMLPVLISAGIAPASIAVILVLKLVIGIACGFTADFFIRKRDAEPEEDIHGFCEREHCSCKDGIFLSALKHTLKILVIIFAVSVLLHIAIEFIPEETLKSVLNFPVISQIAASLIGLIPSCAVSVTLTNLYVNGALGLSPLLCGLLTNGGVGLLVLFRVNKNRKNSLFITALLFASGLVFGTAAGLIFEGII